MTDANTIAARLAAASEVFPIARQHDWDAAAYATAENDVVTITVTEHKNRAKREYRAIIQLVAETPTAPVEARCTNTESGSRLVPTTDQGSETSS